jgi:hypothetical protein
MSATDPALAPFQVGELVATSIEGFLSAAALNLGEPMADGRKLAAPDPMEAWRALLSAAALLNTLSPLMSDGRLVPYQAGLAALCEQLAKAHPTTAFPMPTWLHAVHEAVVPQAPVGSLHAAMAAGLAEARAEGAVPAAPAPRQGSGPLPARPGAGLPPRKGGTDLLFPR